jgi:hypothetical protein
VSITYSECVSVALVIQHAKRMHRIICGLSTLALNGTIFGKKLLNIDVFCFPIQLLSETFLIHRKTERHIINVHRSSRKVPVILPDFYESLILWTYFSRIFIYQNS